MRLDARLRDVDAISGIEVGNVDLAIIGIDAVRQFETEAFAPEDFVCLVSCNHPVSSRRFTLENYLKYSHVSINVARGGQPWIENRLSKEGFKRNITLSTPTSASAALAVAHTEMIARSEDGWRALFFHLAACALSARRVRSVKPAHHCMAWHRRSNDDVAQEWFRDCLRDIVPAVPPSLNW